MILTVRFAAPGLGDLDDEIAVLTEEEPFKIPIIARRTPPEIKIESPIVANPCWLGVRTEKIVKCTNFGGETGFNLLPGNPKYEGKQPNPEVIRIGPFTIYPNQFYLQKGDFVNLYVIYTPESPGEHEEDLILETTFQTRSTYKLKGTGCVLDLEATSLDTMTLNFKESPLSVIYFKVTKPKSVATRTLKIRNNSSMKVQYHWSIYKNKFVEKISLAGEEIHYTIEPLQGVFNGNEEKEFQISFKPIHAESYFEYADLIVDDIPIQAVQDAPEALKELLKPGVGGPTYLGSNTRFPSFPYLKFTLQGYGDSCEIIPDPQVLAFPGDMLINKAYSTKIKLLNKSLSQVQIKIKLVGKSSDKFDIVIGSAKILPVNNQNMLYQGYISEEIEEISVSLQSKIIGNHHAYFTGEVEDGNSFSFEIFGHFTGPRVILKNLIRTLDYGLLRTKTAYEYKLNLENLSDIEAEVLIKNTKNKALTFETYRSIDTNLIERKGSVFSKTGTISNKQASIFIEPEYKKLSPLEKTTVIVTLNTMNPETVDEILEIIVKDQGSQFVSLRAEIQKPHLSLNRAKVDLGKTYAGIQYLVDEKHKYSVILRNDGNHDAGFEWENKVVPDYISAIINPHKGTIKPKSEIQINFSITLYKGGKIEELFICNIEDMDYPLGFLLTSICIFY